MSGRKRLDHLLVESGLFTSRARAQDAIASGHVTIDGVPARKAGQLLQETVSIDLSGEENRYVSRAGLKLAHAIATFEPELEGMVALDVGASTGGFTQVLLEAGAGKVYALDVGHGQLHPSLCNDPRVINIEGVNARNLSISEISEKLDVIVSDVSFISLTLALPPALSMARSGAWLFALIKPQFEAGKAAVGKGGIVRDGDVRQEVCRTIASWLEKDMGWSVAGLIASPIQGSDGNVEFIVAARAP